MRKNDAVYFLRITKFVKIKRTKIYIMEKKSEYIPNPIDVSDIVLPPELNDLAELMAKNVHEVWAQTRISQGWTYGEERNDSKKTHPCLIPYEELPESEREYDRNTAFSTLKLIAKLGFKIGKED